MVLTARSLLRAAVLVLSIGVALLLAIVAKSHGDPFVAGADPTIAAADPIAPP